MKLLKHFLLIGAMFTALSSIQAQESPPVKQRGNSTFQAVDDYLIAVKRLGIPTGTQDDLNAVVAAPNTAKIMFRTDINTLRVYNPVTGLWSNAVPSIDESVLLHTTGNETKTGNLQLNGNLNADGNISSVDGSIRAFRYSNGLGISVLPEFIKFKTDAGNLNYEGRLQAPGISDNRDWYLPDTSGVIAVGNFIKASPATPQNANIDVEGNIKSDGHVYAPYLDISQRAIVRELRTASIEADVSKNPSISIGVGPGGQVLFNMGNDGDVYQQINFGSSGTSGQVDIGFNNHSFKLLNAPSSAITRYSLLTRDSISGEVEQIQPDALGMIKASPTTPQNANINIQGQLNLNGGYIDGVSALYVRGDDGLISSANIGTSKLNAGVANIQYPFFDSNSTSAGNYLKFFSGLVGDERKYSQLRTDNLGFEFINEGQNLFTIGYNGKILLPVQPAVSASEFELLTRDKTTGEIKKIELADLKAMLEAL